MVEELRKKIKNEVEVITSMEEGNEREPRWFRENLIKRHRGRYEGLCEAYKLIAGEEYKP